MPISTASWDPSPSKYTIQQWRTACLIDTGIGANTSYGRYKLPVREASGTVNANGCAAAAGVLAGGRGGVDASPTAKRAAAKALVHIYRNQLKKIPSDGLLKAAGMPPTSAARLAGGS